MKNTYKILILGLCIILLNACGCNRIKTKDITFKCTRNYPVDHDSHLTYQDDYEGIIKDNTVSEITLYYLHLYDNYDSYNEMKNLIIENNSDVDTVFDDKNYTIKTKNINEDNISSFIKDNEGKLSAKDLIKSLEDMEFTCEIKNAKRSDFGLE